jgi:adenine-specific DNA-methyltransferase
VEAVPFPTVLSLDQAEQPKDADVSIARSGESSRQHRWRDELFKAGIRGKGGQILRFGDLEPLPDLRHLHCSGTVTDSGERAVVSFGPEYGALEQLQVEMAIREAGGGPPMMSDRRGCDRRRCLVNGLPPAMAAECGGQPECFGAVDVRRAL